MKLLNNNVSILLYIIALGFTLAVLMSNWEVAVLALIIVTITLIQKIRMDEELEESRSKRARLIEIMTGSLDEISKKISDASADLRKQAFSVEAKIMNHVAEKISEERDRWKADIEGSYRELVRKIVDVENKHNSLKRTVGAGFGALEDRIKGVEKMRGPVIEVMPEEEKEIEDRLSDIFGPEKE
ncbi:MAG: hypothetical protein HZB66_03020 [Candidatus Aenigmarchaeota archaeon]|nr:hypothetical protein [Candidatus Aenigmarchaeota archaeon]